jgi:methylase of polypeptide subunit release factors
MLRPLEKQTIGREHYLKTEYLNLSKTEIVEADQMLGRVFKKHPLRAHIAGNYLNEMSTACARMADVLKPGGFLVLVIGNNQVCGEEFLANRYLREIFVNLGLELILELADDIHSRGLMTKRNKTASLITCEWILLFRKN